MRKAIPVLVMLASLALSGCDDNTTSPRDVTPPASPRGVFPVNGDGQVTLFWLANTEPDVAGYRIYESPCATGPNCPYDRIGTTSGTQFLVTGLTNGIIRYFAVSAVDHAGNESPLSDANIFETPRPSGGATLTNFVNDTTAAGWDFSAAARRNLSNPTADMVYGDNGSVSEMFAADVATDIQDAGFVDFDAVDFAPHGGWSPTGTVELIQGHVYVVHTRDDHFAKFQVSTVSGAGVSFSWAYQTAQGNDQLHARQVGTPKPRPLVWLRK